MKFLKLVNEVPFLEKPGRFKDIYQKIPKELNGIGRWLPVECKDRKEARALAVSGRQIKGIETAQRKNTVFLRYKAT